MENFAGNFFAKTDSEPESMMLSSAAVVTAAKKVQSAFARGTSRRAAKQKGRAPTNELLAGLVVMREVIYTYSLP